jgi:hypothetical protein
MPAPGFLFYYIRNEYHTNITTCIYSETKLQFLMHTIVETRDKKCSSLPAFIKGLLSISCILLSSQDSLEILFPCTHNALCC